jgi:hypothetical protein
MGCRAGLQMEFANNVSREFFPSDRGDGRPVGVAVIFYKDGSPDSCRQYPRRGIFRPHTGYSDIAYIYVELYNTTWGQHNTTRGVLLQRRQQCNFAVSF